MAGNKFAGFPGGGNMNNMIKQAQKMQEQMLKAQQEIEETEVEASSGGGMVTVRATGKKEILEINIKPEAVDPDDVEMLQDLVLVAVNDALSKADALSQEKLGALTGGINIPGLM
ncbi:MAG: YbaB/EbfC family nucleoid-associated protein [Monoglobales bacterium]